MSLIHLPCHRCGRAAAVLETDRLPSDTLERLQGILTTIRSFSWMPFFQGFEIPEVAPGRNPLEAFPPEQIAEFFGVVHAECVALNVLPSSAQADGAHS